MQLVFATHNENKFKEVKALLPHHIELLSLNDIGCEEDIPETAETIEGNAAIKADYITSYYNYACFADDTGLEVPVLNNEPGVLSARYAGEGKNDRANMEKLLRNLEGKTQRDARFKTAIALSMNGKEVMFLGICTGTITERSRGLGGFGYDPIFQPDGYSETFAEMDLATKNEIGHRGRAIRQLIEYLKE
ncbi:non-canonical purine NTP diphosphatase [Altibacter sp. HG106]|uniref:non-canonical purine NTP diphosphatase n=1 Tax=Altibacter sp. HG106 TaxID=3023937 RepID=UPI00234FCED1|nr:non-canonical purine NTP diphosphatase [Altibacter sp. HG106]MDC7993740.1 non-canonical purine NTP diphosphatase [Altibacter sp. HG106]